MKHITFTYDNKTLSGIIISEKANSKKDLELTIKLDSGYNLVVLKKDLKILTQEENKEANKQKEQAQSKVAKNTLPTIRILNTGGTIASKVDYSTGAVISSFSAHDIHTLFPELQTLANVESELVWNISSEMMRFNHWNILAKAVNQAIKDKVKGVIIGHGTDTLHMSAAALAFALENCPIPVIFVGSQRSSDRPSSDAASNLLCATKFILETHFQGVAICMHETVENDTCAILPATRTRKMHSSRRDAFRAINDKAFATISYPQLTITKHKEYPTTKNPFSLRLFNEKLKIGLCKIHPHMFSEELSVYKNFDGLVLELTGMGHAPTQATDEYNKENANIMKEICELTKKIPVCGAPQTIYGRIDMNVYTPGRELIAAGILGQGCDMTPETAFVKLAWLLSNEPKKVRELYSVSLRGEISSRIGREFE